MTCWETLGIHKTHDENAIKDAYNSILHKLTADELADRYSSIREAYEEAISYARQPAVLLPLIVEQTSRVEQVESNTIDEETPLFRRELNTLIKDKKKRIQPDYWDLILHKFDSDNYFPNQKDKQLVLDTLSVNYYLLPKEILNKLVAAFSLDSADFSESESNSILLKNTLTKIQNAPNFSFHITNQLPESKVTTFFNLRYSIYENLLSDNTNEAIKSMQTALAITRNDSDLLNLRMVILVRKNLEMFSSKRLNFQELASVSSIAKRLKPKNLTSAVFEEFVTIASHRKKRGASEEYNEAIDRTYLPDDIKELMHGYFFFDQMNYDSAFTYWLKLPVNYRHVLMPKLKKKRAYLSMENAELYQNENQRQGLRLNRINRVNPVIVIGIIILLVVVMTVLSPLLYYINWGSRIQSDTSSYSYSWNEDGDVDYEDPYYYDLEDGYASTEESFVYFYLKTDDEYDRQLFSNTRVASSQRTYFQEKLLLEPAYPDANMIDFDYFYDKTEEYGYATAVEYKNNVILIIVWDENDKISHVFGNGWEEMPEDKFNSLAEEIKINSSTSMEKFMLDYYLKYDERTKNLEEIKPYLTDDCYTLLKSNIGVEIADNMLGSSYTWSILPTGNECAIIYNESDDMELILGFSSDGRLEHVYGENWENLSDDDLEYVMDNSGYGSYYVDDHYTDDDNWQNNIPDQGL